MKKEKPLMAVHCWKFFGSSYSYRNSMEGGAERKGRALQKAVHRLPNPFLIRAPGKGLIRRLCWGMNFDQADKPSWTRVLLNGWGYICQGWIWQRSWLGLTVFNSSVEHLKEAVAVAKELTKFTDVNGDRLWKSLTLTSRSLPTHKSQSQGHKVCIWKCKSKP